ncbi:hypothetical protein MNEG_14372 [Monoraphidium neglectum]|uniref:Uncharacterized protein n=1 Tax=Monoraphidium neglectum TaxID=145388 RepID=A0A0D2LPB0_9CHLO|nr:hypothetical protein MNEG_14372 [Monoraphidium neglectum]KIY93589.1 hypothetical protein MNEG_14372 [Monoraphidium neglectum]|eukprot:XP_013892609.1 hypothetical protein MNEG_14372 [Monoraphidium neglectum]
MVLLLAEAGVRMRGQSKPFAFASEQVLPHAARLLGYKATYPEYTSGPAAQQETNAQAPASGSAPPSERREEL